MTDVCVVGSFMMDLIVRSPRFPLPGETVTGISLTPMPGGKGFNQAIAAARAGASTAMVGCLGDDAYGAEFREWMRREGVDAEGVATTTVAGSGTAVPIVDDRGQNAIVIVPQANLEAHADTVQASAEKITGSKCLVMQLEIPDDANVEAARIAQAAGVHVVLNPAPFRELSRDLLELVDLVVPNEHELDQLAESLGIVRGDTEETARAVRDAIAVDLVVTIGADGALVVDSEGATTHPVPDVKPINTVGAGDTFTGNLAAGLARGASLRDATERANIAATISVTRVGAAASTPTSDEVDAFIRQS